MPQKPERGVEFLGIGACKVARAEGYADFLPLLWTHAKHSRTWYNGDVISPDSMEVNRDGSVYFRVPRGERTITEVLGAEDVTW